MRLAFLGLIMMSACTLAPGLRGDEGMWLFNDLPVKHLSERYGFEPTPEWAEHLMKSSVRFNVGGSASFVSSNGLVLTNHHVASDTLQKLSSEENNYLKDGFLAKSQADELKAPDLELNQLVAIQDVTERVNAAVSDDMTTEQAVAARRAVISEIEKEYLDATGFRSDVVTLYGGARYHLYQYKKYTDVRLVWAPESAIAFFGGDADNFEYPRFCLDACLFRVYENDKPAQIEHFLKWAEEGAKGGELVFVSGNPGRTSRIFTVAALQFQRDVRMPFILNLLRRREIALQQFGLRGTEQARRAQDDLFGIQNSRKAYLGMLGGLQDPAVMSAKAESEKALREQIALDPNLSKYSDAFGKIEETQRMRAELLSQTVNFNSQLVGIAQRLVQMAAEDQKPSTERLAEYADAGRESLLQQLFSSAPIYADLEQFLLADALSHIVELRGGNDPWVAKVLMGKSPIDRAAELIAGTKLIDVETRKSVSEGGQAAIDSSEDTMIQFALLIDEEVRRVRKANEEVAEIEKQSYAKITEANFATLGTSVYPDATFTLRLSFGPVMGYEQEGEWVEPFTHIGGTYEREASRGGQKDFVLPDSWKEAKDRMNLEIPFNFVCTADIIGGNSGSPVVNTDGELVGLIFDGNIQSLTADYLYTDRQTRAVSVNSSAILEALRVVYDAQHIVNELGK
ncbi:MAG: S46 family peptidase [Pirellulaceae bacterium]|nr:S46 family peptidase [Pirellulaceae bacterium]